MCIRDSSDPVLRPEDGAGDWRSDGSILSSLHAAGRRRIKRPGRAHEECGGVLRGGYAADERQLYEAPEPAPRRDPAG